MPKVETVTVELPVELVAKVRDAVQEGDYASSDAAISDALASWSQSREHLYKDAGTLKSFWQEVENDSRPGLSVDEVFGPLKARYQAMIGANGK